MPITVETLKRGMVLSEREDPPNGGPKKYLRGDEFLMKNPHKKVKKKKDDKKKKGGRSMSPKKARGGKSPKRRVGSAGSDDAF